MSDPDKTHGWIHGAATRGDGRGRTLGFPTANLFLKQEQTRPADGIYACWARIIPKKDIYKGVLHVGPRPTFPGVVATVELHLLDFPDRDLYGEKIAFRCVERLRGIEKFSSSEELIAAIEDDIASAIVSLNKKRVV